MPTELVRDNQLSGSVCLLFLLFSANLHLGHSNFGGVPAFLANPNPRRQSACSNCPLCKILQSHQLLFFNFRNPLLADMLMTSLPPS